MAMFDDPNKELQKLQEQLLKDEEWFARELDSAKKMIGAAPGMKTRPAAPRQQKPMDQTQVFRTEGSPKAEPKAAPKKPAAPVVRNTEDSNLKLDEDTKKKDSKSVPQKKKKKKKKKSNKDLIILASLETLGIVGVVAYWLIFLL